MSMMTTYGKSPAVLLAQLCSTPPPDETLTPGGSDKDDADPPTVRASFPFPVGTYVWGKDKQGKRFEGVVRKTIGSDGLTVQLFGEVTVPHTMITGSIEPSQQFKTVWDSFMDNQKRFERALAAAKRPSRPKKKK